MIDSHPLYPLISKIRPGIKGLEGNAQLQAFSEMLMVLYLLPFSAVGLVWLVLATNFAEFTDNFWFLTLLVLAFFITNLQTATVFVEIEPQKNISLSSSLGSVIFWAGVLIWGPVVIWANLLADLLNNFYDLWRNRRFHQNVFWGPFALYLENLAPLIGTLLALSVYRAMGGVFPFTSIAFVDWIPALVAILMAATFPGLLLLPAFAQIGRLANVPINFSSAAVFFVTAVGFGLIPAPFGIPVALLFIRGGAFPFAVVVFGVVLVNLLAHHLSRTNQRNIQQSREMAQLEKLGEKIIESSEDGSQLAKILLERVKAMFSDGLDIFEIRIFDDVALTGYAGSGLHILHPGKDSALEDANWDELRQSEQDYLVLKNRVPQGSRSVYGDGILVKITSAVPLAEGEKPACIGGVYLLRNKTVARTIDSLDSVQALASQVATALYRSQVYAETLAAEKMSQELAFAGRIQASFLPEFIPKIDGWSIAASLTPARQTSGDFYDFIQFEDGKLGFLVADVADKGTGAALYMALSRTLIRTFALQYPDQPAEALRLANERILEDSRADQFVTVFYGVLDPATSTLVYCNAGHNPPYLLGSNNHTPVSLTRTGMALGAMDGMFWEQKTAQFADGDFLLTFSDGVTEAQNTAEEFFGEQNLIDAGQSLLAGSAEEIHANIMEQVRSFVGSAPQFDDITLMVIKSQQGA